MFSRFSHFIMTKNRVVNIPTINSLIILFFVNTEFILFVNNAQNSIELKNINGKRKRPITNIPREGSIDAKNIEEKIVTNGANSNKSICRSVSLDKCCMIPINHVSIVVINIQIKPLTIIHNAIE